MSDEKSKPVRDGHRQPQHENEGNLNPEDNGQGMETSSESSSSNPENVDNQKREADEPAEPVAGCSEKNGRQSPTSASGDNLPPEGAVGGQVSEEQSGALLDPDEDLRSRCARLDGKVDAGKAELMSRYLGHGIRILPRPDENSLRTRHNGTLFQGSIPIPSQFSSENPLGHLQTHDPEQGHSLNQAGAIVGTGSSTHQGNGNDVASGNNGQLVGFGSGRGVTKPIGGVTLGGRSDTSSREMSSSHPQSSSECHDRSVSPLPLPSFQQSFGARARAARMKISPGSTSGSGNRQETEQPQHVRRKRPAENRPSTIPSGESEFAGSEGSSDHKKPRTDHDYSAAPEPPAPDSDKNENSPEPASEDTESYSIGSELIQPVPDLAQDVPPPPVNEANPPGPPGGQEPIGESSNEEDTAMDVSASGDSKNGEKRQSDES